MGMTLFIVGILLFFVAVALFFIKTTTVERVYGGPDVTHTLSARKWTWIPVVLGCWQGGGSAVVVPSGK